MAGEADSKQHDLFGIVGSVQAKVFHVERAVAEGGFGVVYRANHDVFRAPVALKCLKLPDNLSEEQKADFLERFRSEAELMFRLSAALPEVVRPLQFGVLDTQELVPFLALEWLEGVTLDRFVADRAAKGKPPLTPSQALEILGPVARVLARAHAFNDRGNEISIIHRDVKPENVFLADIDGERVTRVLDFGIARVRAATNAIAGHATGADIVKAFSPAYAAPEQWSPESFGGPGPWTDVYGLALTFQEVILGRPPIGGDLTAMMGAALDPERRPTPRTRGAKISDGLEQVFVKALALDPRHRTQSIEAFWTQLEVATGRQPSITRRFGTSAKLGSVPPPAPELELELPVPPVSAPQAPPPPPPPPAAASHARPAPPPSARSFDTPPSGLDLGGLEVQRAPRPARRPPRAEAAGLWVAPPPELSSRSLAEKFGGPAWLVVAALAIGSAEIVYFRATGERLDLPVRPIYLAGPLGILGLTLILIRLFKD